MTFDVTAHNIDFLNNKYNNMHMTELHEIIKEALLGNRMPKRIPLEVRLPSLEQTRTIVEELFKRRGPDDDLEGKGCRVPAPKPLPMLDCGAAKVIPVAEG